MLRFIKNIAKKCFLTRMYWEHKIHQSETKRFISEIPFANEIKTTENLDINSIITDYKCALKIHRVSWSEYFYQYEFWKLNNDERNGFISRSNVQKMYRKLVHPEVRELMQNKQQFLSTFKKYIHRHWIHISESSGTSIDELKAIINNGECIIKPTAGALGQGIRKISAKDVNNYEKLYNDLRKENVLIEECLKACDEIQSLNPDSLNTIRVVTISKAPKVVVFGAFIRMGRKGAIVDNAHAGGIFAQINVDSGVIESCGITTNGDQYDTHPDTGVKLLGFQIPHWEEIKKQCIDAALSIDNLYFAGWDVCVRPDGKIEFIEGNHGPDFDVMQSPLKIGVKEKLNKITTEYFNYELK